jgi:hypothetical protein
MSCCTISSIFAGVEITVDPSIGTCAINLMDYMKSRNLQASSHQLNFVYRNIYHCSLLWLYTSDWKLRLGWSLLLRCWKCSQTLNLLGAILIRSALHFVLLKFIPGHGGRLSLGPLCQVMIATGLLHFFVPIFKTYPIYFLASWLTLAGRLQIVSRTMLAWELTMAWRLAVHCILADSDA